MASNPSRRRTALTLFFAVIILTPSMLGFVAKFIEFIHTFRGEANGLFAITPMVNYLLASAGFMFLLLWATFNGVFQDLEGPKYTMLEREQELDRGANHPPTFSK